MHDICSYIVYNYTCKAISDDGMSPFYTRTVATYHGRCIHPCGGAVDCDYSAHSSSKKCFECVIIHNITKHSVHTVPINNVSKQCIWLLYTYNLNSEENGMSPDTSQVSMFLIRIITCFS